MGIVNAKIGDPRPSTPNHPDTTPSKTTYTPVSPREPIDWEQIYRERFSRAFIFSSYTLEPLFDYLWKPGTTHRPWKDRLNTENRWNQCNPRYKGSTPEPLTQELAARTRHELKVDYRRCLIEGSLRRLLRVGWEDSGSQIVRTPYLSGEVDFPPPSETKNGDILPARVRAEILGQTDEVPVDQDPFLQKKLLYVTMRLRLAHPSQAPYEDDLLSRGPWLNQTTAVYFEPKFAKQVLLIWGAAFSRHGGKLIRHKGKPLTCSKCGTLHIP